MKISYFLSFAALLALPLLLTSCDKDDPIIPNEEELITTIIFKLDPGNIDASIVTLSFVLDLKVASKSTHISNFDIEALASREIVVNQHCYGCTAGAGSSCGGELV